MIRAMPFEQIRPAIEATRKRLHAATNWTMIRVSAKPIESAFVAGATILFLSIALCWIWRKKFSARVEVTERVGTEQRVLNGEIIPPPAVDLTSAGGGEIPNDTLQAMFADYGGMTTADVTPEFSKQWTNEMIGYEFHSLHRQIDMLKRAGKIRP